MKKLFSVKVEGLCAKTLCAEDITALYNLQMGAGGSERPEDGSPWTKILSNSLQEAGSTNC